MMGAVPCTVLKEPALDWHLGTRVGGGDLGAWRAGGRVRVLVCALTLGVTSGHYLASAPGSPGCCRLF